MPPTPRPTPAATGGRAAGGGGDVDPNSRAASRGPHACPPGPPAPPLSAPASAGMGATHPEKQITPPPHCTGFSCKKSPQSRQLQHQKWTLPQLQARSKVVSPGTPKVFAGLCSLWLLPPQSPHCPVGLPLAASRAARGWCHMVFWGRPPLLRTQEASQ